MRALHLLLFAVGVYCGFTLGCESKEDPKKRVEISVFKEDVANISVQPARMLRTEVVVAIRQGNLMKFTTRYEENEDSIRSEVRSLLMTAPPRYVEEPAHDTLSKKVGMILNQYIGMGSNKQMIIEEVYITELLPIVISGGSAGPAPQDVTSSPAPDAEGPKEDDSTEPEQQTQESLPVQ